MAISSLKCYVDGGGDDGSLTDDILKCYLVVVSLATFVFDHSTIIKLFCENARFLYINRFLLYLSMIIFVILAMCEVAAAALRRRYNGSTGQFIFFIRTFLFFIVIFSLPMTTTTTSISRDDDDVRFSSFHTLSSFRTNGRLR